MKIPSLAIKSILLAALVILAFGYVWTSYHSALRSPVVTNGPVTIEINKGDSFTQITEKLVDAKIAIQPIWFTLLAFQNHAFDQLKAGEYELAGGLTMSEILFLLVLGKTKHYALTIPEGWSYKQFANAIANEPKLKHTIDPNNHEHLRGVIGAEKTHPEGLFFPDTYYYEKHTTDVSLLKRAYDKMQDVLLQEWHNKAADLPFTTPYEALTLASIVEKETAVPAERPMIAGVFIKRLKQGMPLQTDPTVIYGMGDHFQGNIRHDDLLQPTPYNTYLIKGLPPTPIALPGLDSIKAVLHPDQSPYLYFVAKGDGSHAFSATLKEHNAAVATYQTKQRHGTR